jgi:predicted  nucleic acid-binding Zn-ribbon protein
MGPLLEGLKKLQAVENQLRAAKTKLNRCRRSVILQENQIRSLQNALEAKKEEIQLTKVQADRLELEMKTRDEIVGKLRASLNAAKTNKEYSAVLTQLNTTRADNSKIETQVLELMKGIDEDQVECEKIRNQIEEQKRLLDQIRKDSEVLAVKYEAEIQEIQAHWNQVAAAMPVESLDTFKRVAETYDGEAIGIVEKAESKNDVYNCGGCFMGVTVESVNVLLTKDEIIRCPNCTRILILDNT